MPTQPASSLSSATGTIEVQVDGQTPESWSAILDQFEDANIYQSWAYGAVRWGAKNLSHLVLRREGQVIAAAQFRIARVPVLPAGVAYLRWGPLCHRKGQPLHTAVVREMLVQLQREYGQRRGLSLKVIANAFANENRATEYAAAMTNAGLAPEADASPYRTVVVDLTPAPEAMRKALDQKWRNQLNRSEKNDLTLEVSDGSAAYREFLGLYKGMWERKRFETSVDPEEFGRMQDLLTGSARMQTFLAKKDSQAIGSIVCSLTGTTAIYLLGATDDKARELKAAYYLQWQAMLWLKQHGARAYDLGGIDPVSNPGGYHFKSGFGGTDVTQLPPHSHPGGLLSRSVTAFINWRRRKA